MESMIKVGVLDEFGSRRQLLEALDRIIGHSGRTHEAAAVGQMSLFGGDQGNGMDIAIELLRPEDEFEKTDLREELAWEKDLIGVYVSEHPLNRYAKLLTTHVSATSADFDPSMHGRGVTVLGLLTSLRGYTTKKGASMAFGAMEDLQGSFDLIFFPRTWAQNNNELQVDRVYLVRGELKVESDDRAKIIVETITNNLSMALPLELEPEKSVSKPPSKPKPIGSNGNEARPVRATGNGSHIKARPGTFSPPPPPNFEEEDGDFAAPAPDELEMHDLSESELEIDTFVEEESRQTMLVEIKAVRNWQNVCRQIVKLMTAYKGQDTLSIKIAGKALQMEFPNLATKVCPDSVDEVKKLTAVKRVRIV
jgi:hypothetical protein